MNLRILILPFFVFFSIAVLGQDETENLQLTKKDSIVTSSWIAGLGFNAVDDAGTEFTNFFNVSDNWNIVPYPSRISIGKYFKNGLGIEFIGAYNQYQEGKFVDGFIISEAIDYYSGDLRFSYDLNKILGETGFFDPYVGLGAGYTEANNQGRGTYNATLGFRTWFNDRVGLDFNSTGKWTMNPDNSTNHLQHAAGVVYRFAIEKGLSKKGEEKLARIKEIEEKQKKMQDSINIVRQAEEEQRLLAERLKREEEERLAAAASEKQAIEDARRTSIDEAINALGYVYFDLNSSYLPAKGKGLLDELALILLKNPSVILEISSHTDSRGTSKYNQWLSERRVMRTANYLIAMGIDENRLKIKGLGENELTNECVDRVPCPEEKHRENRRSQFKVLEY
ncbi:OmpA family protein [Croceivirga thetidis]|uniref:OmpA family protein n=1 Tax=Croceivirga thetidis TaxID=2721623 RepID=A0ABX1GSM2_9FLAO|nr:OmpA family protein [Croceivirga thetidis]NKI32001.1 OmpA family protein [Croceivirga thetidis]